MSDRLRVLLFPTWYPSPENPWLGTFVRDMAVAISRVHDVTVLAPPSPSAQPDAVEDGVRTLRLPAERRHGRIATLLRLRALNAAVTRLQVEGNTPQIIHADVFAAGVLAVLVGRRRRIPVLITEHSSGVLTSQLSWWGARTARFAYSRTDLVVADSPLLQGSILRLAPHARSEVVPEVVDVDRFADAPASRERPGARLLAVGLAEIKGIPHLLEAMRLLVRDCPEVSLEIVGDGPGRLSLEAEACGLPVTFLGSLPRSEVAQRMREADVFVMPSLAECFGISAVEALSARLPVVVTTTHGSADVIKAHGGVVVPPADPLALRDAIATLLERPDAVPASTTDDIRRWCGPAAVAERYDRLYRELVLEGGNSNRGRAASRSWLVHR